MGANQSVVENKNSNWMKISNNIRQTFEEIELRMASGLSYECQNINKAIEEYKKAIESIDTILNLQISSVEENGEDVSNSKEWNEICSLVQQLKQYRADLLKQINTNELKLLNTLEDNPKETIDQNEMEISTINVINDSNDTNKINENLIANENNNESNENNNEISYEKLAKQLEELQVEIPGDCQVELIYVNPSIQVYIIKSNGNVITFQQPSTLKINQLKSKKKLEQENGEVIMEERNSFYLELDEWIYPLVASISPCYKTRYNAFIFPFLPNNNANDLLQIGDSIGIILKTSEEYDELLVILQSILCGVVGDISETLRQKRGISHTISYGLVNGAWYIQQGLIKGAEKTGQLLSYGTPKLFNYINPNAGKATVSPTVTKGLDVTKNVTGTAANVTGIVAKKVGDATSALAHYLAPHIEKQGTKLISKSFKVDENDAQQQMDSILQVAASAVEGFSTVYNGLEQSSTILGQSLKDNTVKIVEHKYGEDAANATKDTFDTVGNVYNINRNMRYFKPKTVAKIAAKSTGKAVLNEIGTTNQQQILNQHLITNLDLTQVQNLNPTYNTIYDNFSTFLSSDQNLRPLNSLQIENSIENTNMFSD